ncbi:MAG: tRNA (uridine(34)/cytosine(34)/5-carboxymethylaminomethyluridine(34)-2'-O)-methyltransferase TrmL [Clostridiales bacterium]|nr:tRNA (uridine(34)/cytosine(34)/5-carboxymethylaminomethyluridine(34)-2'-O)-methyltransferase TrmL [Clostridiales bacterium]
MNIVLVEPEIPQNTGTIARTCAATNTSLHLVRPLGFSTDDKYLKRAGLDYWKYVDIHYYDCLDEFFKIHGNKSLFFASTKSKHTYCDVAYGKDSYILFGKETKGLDEKLLKENYDKCIRIPMANKIRSLNLSNSVNIILYEALRQQQFANLLKEGVFPNER